MTIWVLANHRTDMKYPNHLLVLALCITTLCAQAQADDERYSDLPAYIHTKVMKSCGPMVSPSGLYLWDESGNYLDTVLTYAGQDSIVEVILTVENWESELVYDNGALISTADAAYFQWYRCDGDEVIYVNEGMTPRYVPKESGSYTCEVTSFSGCVATSECVYFGATSVEELSLTDAVTIAPNPFSDVFQFKNKEDRPVAYSIYNHSGLLVHEGRLDAYAQREIGSHFAPGIYHIYLQGREHEGLSIVKY